MPKPTSKRRKNHRTIVPTPRVAATNIERAPAGASLGLVGGLLDHLAARLVADERHRREGTDESRQALVRARARLADALDYLRRVKGRRTEVEALLGALASDGGAMLAAYTHAHEDYRAAIRAAVLAWADTVERRRIGDPSTIELLARAHLEAGVSAALRGRALRLPIDHPDAAAFREEARKAGNASRLDIVAGLALASEAHEAPQTVDVLALIERAAEERSNESSEPVADPSIPETNERTDA